MKVKEFFYLLGLRPSPRRYGFDIRRFMLPRDGAVEYAQWLHPNETEKVLAQATVNELRHFLRPGDSAIDIGAHTGDTALPIALAVGPTGCVLALEPNPYVFPVLTANAALNPAKCRIVPLMIAAAAQDRGLTFEYSDAGYCNGGAHDGISRWRHGSAFKLSVQGRQLDRLLREEFPDVRERLRFIKVDAEGADHAILESVAALLAEMRPFLKVEVFKGSPREARESLLHFLHGLGYRVHRVISDQAYRGEVLEASDMMRWPHYDVFAVPPE